ncbi:MAG: acyl-CoA thioesterase [Alphaproteobacteria bacterium RIFCSPHIGHO2_12_FULL_66_14]|nr:MAG: acyl-CoA thioesterase [Alphaproteobacteria bacterium RIFCSPHIGHO2_12_FULL_66_14]
MPFLEIALTEGLQGSLLKPGRQGGWGVIVLGGSSGRVDVARAGLFADYGAVVIALRWFGGEGQSPGICEIPLESFAPAIQRLIEEGCDRIALVGTSKGAEAALLVASHDPRVDAVVAISPSSVVWANTGPGMDGIGWPLRSSFTHRGTPLPFVPFEAEALLSVDRRPPVRYLELHRKSLQTFAAELPQAAIPIERARADVILVAGEDDALWPSAIFAKALSDRLQASGKAASLVLHPTAGHRVLLPGETTAKSAVNEHGGTDQADRELGRAAWSEISRLLKFVD